MRTWRAFVPLFAALLLATPAPSQDPSAQETSPAESKLPPATGTPGAEAGAPPSGTETGTGKETPEAQAEAPEAMDEAAPGEEMPPASDFKPPKFDVLRYREDWSGLREFDRDAGDFFDPIKYVPITDDGRFWASFGGQWRSRIESWSAFGFNNANSDTFWLNRFLYHADLHATEYLRVFAQGKSSFSTPRDLPGGKRTLDVDELDVQNAFADLSLPLGDDSQLTVRPGRQELLYGQQRLISPLDWGNTRRTFDGVSAFLKLADWTISPFWSEPVTVDKYDLNTTEPSRNFYGVYAAGKPFAVHEQPQALDLYFLGLDHNTNMFNGTAGIEERFTAGGRIGGDIGESGVLYDLEGAYQFGTLGSGDIDAFMVAIDLGYRFDLPWKPLLLGGFDYASGDEEPGGDVETFNQLFPLAHAYLGFMDFVARQNVIDVRGRLAVEPLEKTTLQCDVHYFQLAEKTDALYNAGGAVVRAPGGTTRSRDVGTEVDITVKRVIDSHLVAVLGYSHFFPGDFIDETGSSDAMDFVYLMGIWTF